MFLFHTETHFFEHYLRFYRDIERKATFARIEKNHQAVMRSIFGSARHFFLLQGSIACLAHHAMRAQHPKLVIHLGIVGADHASFHRAHMVGIVEREIRHPPEGPQLLAMMGSTMRLARVFDKRNAAPLQLTQ